MIEARAKQESETVIPPELVAEYLSSLVGKGNYFGVIEIHMERKIVRVKNRQTYIRADLEEIIRA